MGNPLDSDLPDLLSPKNHGGKKLANTELNKLALNANLYIRWPGIENPTDSINQMIDEKCRTGELRNVYSMGGKYLSAQYVAKITIRGKQHRICISNFRFRLARYVDAATLYFWKYRRASDRRPEDSDFNTSLDIAKQLLAVPSAYTQLQFLEKYLLDSGELLIATEQELCAERKARDFIRELRIARKYIERSRRYVRNLTDFELSTDQITTVAKIQASLTENLEDFSDVLQINTSQVVNHIRNKAHE